MLKFHLLLAMATLARCGGDKPSDDRTDAWYLPEYRKLTQGITGQIATDYQSIFVPFGEKAFPVTTSSAGIATTVAGEYKQGRFFSPGNYDTFFGWGYESAYKYDKSHLQFVTNAVSWLARGKANPTILCRDSTYFLLMGHPEMKSETAIKDLATLKPDVYVMISKQSPLSKEEASQVLDFVAKGGSLLAVGNRGPAGLADDQYVEQADFNRVFLQLGFVMGREIVGSTDSVAFKPTPQSVPAPESHMSVLKTMDMKNDRYSNLAQLYLGYLLVPATAAVAEVSQYFELCGKLVEADNNQASWVALPLRAGVWAQLCYPKMLLKASDTAFVGTYFKPYWNISAFPFDAPANAALKTKVLAFEDRTQGSAEEQGQYQRDGWLSTGAFAKGASIITVKAQDSVVGKGLKIQIGCHTDALPGFDNKPLKRNGKITLTFTITSADQKIASPYGGLIYVIPPSKGLGKFTITLEGIVEAPYFVLGTTTEADWHSRIKNLPAPWAEIEAPGKVVFTVSSHAARNNMTSPQQLMELWVRIINYADELRGYFGTKNRVRTWASRFVFDVQVIGPGWYHAGYPMLGHLPTDEWVVNYTSYFGDNNQWLMYHEIGHNQQHRSWELNIECTNLLWSLYIDQKLGVIDGHTDWRPLQVLDFKKRLNPNGLPSADTSIPDTACLQTYSILADEYSWKDYTTVFQSYDDQPIITGNDCYNQWALRFSRQVKQNLCPYFENWLWPITDATRSECIKLPKPAKDLMKKYDDFAAWTPYTGTCPDGWLRYKDACFFISSEYSSWGNANDKCQEKKGHLATCLSAGEANFLAYQSYLVYYDWYGFWLGLNCKNGKLSWSSGESPNPDALLWKRSSPKACPRTCGFVQNGFFDNGECSTSTEQFMSSKKYMCKIGGNSCAATCPPNWVAGEGGKCYLLSKEPATYDQAVQKCKVQKGELASCFTPSETQFLSDLTYAYGYSNTWWIGLDNSQTKDDHFKWISGASASITWDQGYPRYSAAYHCGIFYRGSIQNWDCSKSESYICKTGGDGTCKSTKP